MRIIKYIISATLLAAICFFIVESYAQHVLGGFEVEYATVRVTPEAQVNAKDVNGELTDKGTLGQGQRQHAMSWLCVLLSTVMLTLYDIALRRKEALIRLVSGQDLKWFAAKGAAADCAFYGIYFCVSFVVCGRMSSLAASGNWRKRTFGGF